MHCPVPGGTFPASNSRGSTLKQIGKIQPFRGDSTSNTPGIALECCQAMHRAEDDLFTAPAPEADRRQERAGDDARCQPRR
jgi:hypothetical protein